MSYIGQTLPADTFQGFITDSFTGDGSATTFTLSKTPFNESALLVVINNVVQKPTTNFTVSGTTLTIVGTAVADGDVIYATHIGGALPIGQAASLDLNGASDQLILDADADTTISADTDDQIDIKIGGSDIATLTTSSLTLKNSATADNSTFTLNLQTAESDIAADDVIGKIAFAAPSEGTGTDANLTAAAIQARSEGDFSSSSNATELQFMTGASEAATTKMTLSSNGLLGIGTEAPQRFLHILGTDGTTSLTEGNSRTVLFLENNGATYVNIASANNNNGAIFFSDGDANNVGGITYKHASNDMEFTVNAKDYMKITDDGFFKFSKNETFLSTAQFHEFLNTEGDQQILYCRNSDSSSPYGIEINFSGAAPDNNTNWFLNCSDTGTSRFRIESDGDAQNHDNAYGSISDERIKSNITDANSQWDDIKAIKVRNFERKDDINKYGVGKKIQIGVVAQEIESVSPGLVKEGEPTSDEIKVSSEFGTVYEDGDTLPENKRIGDVKTTTGEKVKRVNYSVLYMKAIKALQEAMAKIETLEADVKTLKGE